MSFINSEYMISSKCAGEVSGDNWGGVSVSSLEFLPRTIALNLIVSKQK